MRERWRKRKTEVLLKRDRQTDRQTDRQIKKETDRQAGRQREGQKRLFGASSERGLIETRGRLNNHRFL